MNKPETEIKSIQQRCRSRDYAFAGVYLFVVLFLFWRCRFGFAYDDETFYLTIPYRICMGDRLLLHEWHLTQLSGILLIPLVKLYLILFHNTEGIVLCFRYIFTVVWATEGLFLWWKLKRFSDLGAMATALCFVLYAPYGIMALSYHSLSMLLLIAASTLLITNDRQYSDVVAGVLYSGAVLSSPLLVLMYPVSAIGALIAQVLTGRNWKGRWLRFTGGVMLAFVPFCVMLLMAGSIRDYLHVLPYILDDPEHPTDLDLILRIRFLIYYAQSLNPYWKWAVDAAIIIIVVAAITRQSKLGFVLICADTLFLLITHLTGFRIMNVFMFPACFIGLYCFLFDDDTRNKALFWGMWIPGALYSFCHFLASNQYYYVLSHAAGIMTIASILMGSRYVNKCRRSSVKQYEKFMMTCALGAVILCQLSCELGTRYQQVYSDEDIRQQTIQAEAGPEKGILMNWDIYEYYMIAEKDIEDLNDNRNTRKVLLLTDHSWLYLSAQKEFSAYSAWLQPINEHTVEKLQAYYELFPGKRPDAIYFDRDYQSLMPLFEDGYHESNKNTSEYARIMEKAVQDQ